MIERNNEFISNPCFSTSPNPVISTTSHTMIILCLASRAIYCWFWWLVLQLIALFLYQLLPCFSGLLCLVHPVQLPEGSGLIALLCR